MLILGTALLATRVVALPAPEADKQSNVHEGAPIRFTFPTWTVASAAVGKSLSTTLAVAS